MTPIEQLRRMAKQQKRMEKIRRDRMSWLVPRAKHAQIALELNAPALLAEIDAIQAKLRDAEDALRFYVDPFDRYDEDGDIISVPDFYGEMDFGQRARDYFNKHGEKND